MNKDNESVSTIENQILLRELLIEAKFYQLPDLVKRLEKMLGITSSTGGSESRDSKPTGWYTWFFGSRSS